MKSSRNLDQFDLFNAIAIKGGFRAYAKTFSRAARNGAR